MATIDPVLIAREWIGTPYMHQASRRGVGADCLGLVRGVWQEIYKSEPEAPPPYTRDWGEFGEREMLLEGALRYLCPIHKAKPSIPGEVLLFRMRRGSIAKHLGILANVGAMPTFIHAYEGSGVVESPLSAPWRDRIAGRFLFPDD